MLALFHSTGRGTLFLYQGQEIGMANSKQWTFEQLKDVEEINHYNNIATTRPAGADMSDVLGEIARIGRDNARMPVSWDSSHNAGFSTGEPWIKVNEDYKEWNVAVQETDEDSVLSFWKRLLKVRKENPGLVYGKFEMLDWDNEEVYAYTRIVDGEAEYLVVCSFSEQVVEWKSEIAKGDVIISNYDQGGSGEDDPVIKLRPYECRLYKKLLE